MLNSFKSIVEPFVGIARKDAHRPAMILISDDNTEQKVSYGQLHNKAVSCARILQHNSIEKQQIVVIALDHSTELVAAFWGVLYCGAIPIIYHYPEHIPNRNKFIEQICRLAKNSGPGA